jgi:hypothetical protein
MNINSNPLLSNSSEISPSFILELLPILLSNKDKERALAEKSLEQYYYNPSLYQNLIEIGLYNTNITDNERMQVFILLRKLLKDKLLENKTNTTPIKMKNIFEENSEKIEIIINNLKLHLRSYLNKGDFSQNYNKIIKDIVCLVSNKYFPYKWKELNSYYIEFFEFDPNKALSIKYFDVAMYISDMFYTTMKNFDSKNKYNPNYEEFKTRFTNSFMKYYNIIKDLFLHHPNGIINDNVNQKCFKLMKKNDKILILLIRLNFSINNFHKDIKTIELVNVLIVRIRDLLIMFEKIKIKSYKIILEQNIFKILEHTVMIIQKDPIIFCYHIDQLISILSQMLKNCNLFQRDTTKVILFNLSKINSTIIYKENVELNMENLSQRKSEENYVTPRKVKSQSQINQTPIHSITSPSKYKNLNKELLKANELYVKSMSNENVLSLLECFINKIPYIYKNENEDTEIEILSHFQEDKSSNRDTFSTDTMTFESLKQYFLDQLIINFTDIIMKFVSGNLKALYSLKDQNKMDFYMVSSFLSIVNTIPNLYQKGIISITKMIDIPQYLSFIEKYAPNNELMLRSYIISLSKWSILLISNEDIIKYINNLTNLLSNTKNVYILLESCLCLQNILKNIDYLMVRHANINTITNTDSLINTIKTKIDWGNLFCKVTEIMNIILPKIESSELLVALIDFFTSLIEKCHVQNDGNIINTIKNSKLIQLMTSFKDEFTEEIYRGMFQKLIINFHKSNTILEICLYFVENRIRQRPSFENFNLLLYVVSKSENNEENKKLIIEFIKRNYNLFTTSFHYNISTVVSDILTQILLYQVFPENEIQKIINLVMNNYINTKDKFIYFYEIMLNSGNNLNKINNKSNNDINNDKEIMKKIDEFCEYKSSLLEVLKISLLIYTNIIKKDITNIFENILNYIFDEIKMCSVLKHKNSILSPSKFNNFNSQFILLLLELMTRLCLYNPTNFQKYLNNYIISNKINVTDYIVDILNMMIETLNFIQRGINVLFISTMITWLGFSFLNNNYMLIFDLVISRITEKKALNNEDSFMSKNKYVDSIRKQKIENNEMLLNVYDIKTNFVQAVSITCKNAGVDINYWINNLQLNNIRKGKLKDILNI